MNPLPCIPYPMDALTPSDLTLSYFALFSDLEFGRYKFIVQVVLGERREQGVRWAASPVLPFVYGNCHYYYSIVPMVVRYIIHLLIVSVVSVLGSAPSASGTPTQTTRPPHPSPMWAAPHCHDMILVILSVVLCEGMLCSLWRLADNFVYWYCLQDSVFCVAMAYAVYLY